MMWKVSRPILLATVLCASSTSAFAQLVSPASQAENVVAPLTVKGERPSKAWRPGPNPIPVEFGADTEICWQKANDPFLAAGGGGGQIFLPTRYPRNPDYSAPPVTPPGSALPEVMSMLQYIRGKPGDPNRRLSVRGKLSDCLGITQGSPRSSARMSTGASAGLSMRVMRADGAAFAPNSRAQMRGRDKTLPLAFALFDHGRYEEALKYFKAAYDKRTGGDGEAQLMIGKIYLFGLGEKSDPVEGVKWLKELVERPFTATTSMPLSEANESEGDAVSQGDPNEPRQGMTPQFDPYEPDRTTPTGEAALILADIYSRGHGPIAKDSPLARLYLETAYRVGHIDAANTLGDIYYYGVDVAPDRAKAFRYYMKAARFGHAPAAVAVAQMYEAGEGDGKADRAKILGWYARAAQIEHPTALQALAVAYDRGDGVAADPQMALAYYKLAATQGDPAAQTAIGTYFYRGEGGLPKDAGLARKWFEFAAIGGDPDGMFNLAAMQARGEGGELDRVKAWGWFRIADRAGHATAAAAALAIETQFTPQDQAGVDALKRAG